MAKILHIANFNMLKTIGPSQNAMQRKISNGLTRIGHNVIDYSDRDLCRIFGFGHMNFWGRKKLNAHLIKFCKQIKPDAIVMGHVDTIDLDTFFEIKKLFPNIRILEWCVDAIVPDAGADKRFNDDCAFMVSRLKKQSAVTDVILMTTGDKEALKQLKTNNNVVGFFPNIVDKSIETGAAYEKEILPHDLLFAANPALKRKVCGNWLNMDDVAYGINAHVPTLNGLFPGLIGTQKLRAADYQNACEQSAMGLSVSHINDVYLYQSDRLAHIVGNGALVFLEGKSGYKDFFGDDEMAFYDTMDELYDKIKFYKNNPTLRQQVAKAGHDKYVKLFNEIRVATYLSDLLFEGKDLHDTPWAIEV